MSRNKKTTYNYGFPINMKYEPTNKELNAKNLVFNFLNKTQRLFQYKNLPETIPQRVLERFLQTNGNCVFYKHNDKYYVYIGSLGGEPDEYYEPIDYIIANPYQKLTKTIRVKDNEDGVLIRNDSYMTGLLPLLNKYAYFLVENEITLDLTLTNMRLSALIEAMDDNAKDSALQLLKEIKEGRQGVIGSSNLGNLLDSIKVNPMSNTTNNQITQLIEMEQYLKGNVFIELGLRSNYNMKREAISQNESSMGDFSLLPFIDDMLECRRKAIKDINEKYGLNIEVDFASGWHLQENETKIELEQLEDENEEKNIEDIDDSEYHGGEEDERNT